MTRQPSQRVAANATILISFHEIPCGVTDVGEVLYSQPYSFIVSPAGYVGHQEFWRGHPHRVVGFANRPTRHCVDLPWHEAVALDLRDVVGKYCILECRDGQWSTHMTAVSAIDASFTQGLRATDRPHQ